MDRDEQAQQAHGENFDLVVELPLVSRPEEDGVVAQHRVQDEPADKEGEGEGHEQERGPELGSAVLEELRGLEQGVGDVVQSVDHDPDAQLVKAVRDAEQQDGGDVVHEHLLVVLLPRLDVQSHNAAQVPRELHQVQELLGWLCLVVLHESPEVLEVVEPPLLPEHPESAEHREGVEHALPAREQKADQVLLVLEEDLGHRVEHGSLGTDVAKRARKT